MSSYDGKSFEKTFQHLAEKAGCDVVRLHDVMTGYKNINSPADFIIALNRQLPPLLIELKVCQSSSFRTAFRQLERLSGLKRFNSYLIIWFTEYKKIVAITIDEVERMDKDKVLSFNPKKLDQLGYSYLDLCTNFLRVNPKDLDLEKLWSV